MREEVRRSEERSLDHYIDFIKKTKTAAASSPSKRTNVAAIGDYGREIPAITSNSITLSQVFIKSAQRHDPNHGDPMSEKPSEDAYHHHNRTIERGAKCPHCQEEMLYTISEDGREVFQCGEDGIEIDVETGRENRMGESLPENMDFHEFPEEQGDAYDPYDEERGYIDPDADAVDREEFPARKHREEAFAGTIGRVMISGKAYTAKSLAQNFARVEKEAALAKLTEAQKPPQRFKKAQHDNRVREDIEINAPEFDEIYAEDRPCEHCQVGNKRPDEYNENWVCDVCDDAEPIRHNDELMNLLQRREESRF